MNSAILELYKQEIVQTSDDYINYLNEYKALINTPHELVWYHIHNIAYLVKSVSVADAIILYPKVFNEFETFFTSNGLNDRLMSYYFYNRGIYLRFKKNYQEAKSNYNKVITLTEDLPYLRYIKFTSYIHLCNIESLEGNYTAAKKNLDLAKNYWNISDSIRSEFIQNRFSAAYYYSQVGQFDSAYHLLLKSTINERLMDFRKNTLKISELNVKLRTTEKENKILLSEHQIDTQNKWLFIISILLFVLVMLLVVVGFAFNKIKSKNAKIETLMKELHHRVKNNLQIISSLLGLQSMKLKDETARKAVAEGKERIRAMSLIHQKLYQNDDFTSININEYITLLVGELQQSYGFKNKAEIIIEVPNLDLDADTTLPLGLIINELVSNAFKYAFQNNDNPVLELKITREPNRYLNLYIKDNGMGLPSDFVMENATSFGMKLVSLLAKQLKATLLINKEQGLAYLIKFQVI